MDAPWEAGASGVLTLPSGLRVRGRGLGRPLPDGPVPTFALHLLGHQPPATPWPSRWVRWRDLGLPSDPDDLADALTAVRSHARPEIACHGGTGRTGTALACLAVCDGLSPDDAVAHVRAHYRPGAVETRRQMRFVASFAARP